MPMQRAGSPTAACSLYKMHLSFRSVPYIFVRPEPVFRTRCAGIGGGGTGEADRRSSAGLASWLRPQTLCAAPAGATPAYRRARAQCFTAAVVAADFRGGGPGGVGGGSGGGGGGGGGGGATLGSVRLGNSVTGLLPRGSPTGRLSSGSAVAVPLAPSAETSVTNSMAPLSLYCRMLVVTTVQVPADHRRWIAVNTPSGPEVPLVVVTGPGRPSDCHMPSSTTRRHTAVPIAQPALFCEVPLPCGRRSRHRRLSFTGSVSTKIHLASDERIPTRLALQY
jgi:hypothetical protein